MWRPIIKNWYALREDKLDEVADSCGGFTGRSHMEYSYEAGADAMLEALKKQGIYNYSGFGRVDFPNARKGWFTFIPEG